MNNMHISGQQLQMWFAGFMEWIQSSPHHLINFSSTLALVMLCSYLIIRRTMRESREPPKTIVLAGLSGSGKTALFYRLRDGSFNPYTYLLPSQGITKCNFVLQSTRFTKKKLYRKVCLVDVRGRSHLPTILDEFFPQPAAIVFVVDSAEFLLEYPAATEYLYDILTSTLVVSYKIPILILCNKVDKINVYSMDFIKEHLENEIDKLRATRAATSGADANKAINLGKLEWPFSFSDCRNVVKIAEGSSLTGDIWGLEMFIMHLPESEHEES